MDRIDEVENCRGMVAAAWLASGPICLDIDATGSTVDGEVQEVEPALLVWTSFLSFRPYLQPLELGATASLQSECRGRDD